MAKNRTELVAEVAEKSGKSQATVNAVLDAVFQVFESSVSKGEKITIPGWLAIERTDRAARTGRNPQTCLLYTSPSPRDQRGSRMPSSA